MNLVKSGALGLAMAALVGGAALAQSGSMSSDNMKSGAMSDHHMMASKSDMKTMNHCKAMSHGMMMKSSKCMKMMKMHPDMMNDGMMSH